MRGKAVAEKETARCTQRKEHDERTGSAERPRGDLVVVVVKKIWNHTHGGLAGGGWAKDNRPAGETKVAFVTLGARACSRK